MAVDLPTIAEGYYGGTVDWKPVGFINPYTAKGFTVPYDQWPADLQAEYNYNPEKAKELLAAAGYPTGFTVKCDAGPMSDLQVLQVMQSYFADINVTMEIEPYDMGAMMNLVATRKHDEMIAQTVAICMPPLMGMQMFTSYEPTSALCHSDLTYDQMVKDCGTIPNTIEEAQKMVSDTDMYLIQQHWGVTTFPLTVYIFWQPYLKGYDGEKVFMNGIAPYFARDWIDQDLKSSMGR
jgi:ABC-type transport system substrate-binding protein